MANKHMMRYGKSLITGDMQMKTPKLPLHTQGGYQKQTANKCRQECGEFGLLYMAGGRGKWSKPFRKLSGSVHRSWTPTYSMGGDASPKSQQKGVQV